MRPGSGPPACRPAPSIPTSGAGIRRSSRSAARGTTSRGRSRSSRRSSAHSGRMGWCPTSSSTRRSRRTPTSPVRRSGNRRPDRPTPPAMWRRPGSRSRPSTRMRRSRSTATRTIRTRRWRSCAGCIRAWSPSTATCSMPGDRPGPALRSWSIRGSPGSTTRQPGIARLTRLVIPPGGVPPYERRDLAHGDPKDRPTNEAYDRFVYLAARYRDSGYDDARLTRRRPVPHRRADVRRDPRLVAVRPGGDRIGRRRGPDATPRGRAGDPCRDHRRALGPSRPVG